MPIKIPDNLPAIKILNEENIFVMTEERAVHQDIRPLRIVLLNLMPNKIATETQFLRLLGNTPLQVDITLLHMATHKSKNTPQEYLIKFYNTFPEICDQFFDGMIITGAPVEKLAFEEVNYWEELKDIMEWSKRHVYSTMHICWGAQAGLYYHYKVPKYQLKEKVFGVYKHTLTKKNVNLFRGFDDVFYVPHSRYTEIKREDVEKVSELQILSESEDSGIYVIEAKDCRQIFVTGHSEYDALSLKGEYDRDINRGMMISTPKNYFPEDDLEKVPVVRWRAHSHLLFSNWLNYYVYQETPFNLESLSH